MTLELIFIFADPIKYIELPFGNKEM
jgi:hypothetical protein